METTHINSVAATAVPPTTEQTFNELLQEYIDSFTEKEQQAYEIAKEFLGTSFQLEKSNGFLQFQKSKKISNCIEK